MIDGLGDDKQPGDDRKQITQLNNLAGGLGDKEEQVHFDPDFYDRLEKVQNKERNRYTGNDAGILAQLALERRWKKDRRKRKIFWWSILILALLIGAVGYALYTGFKTVRDQHVRMCAVSNGDGDYFATGQRVYDYSYYSLLGFQFTDTSKRSEKTQVNVNGQKMIVVGITGNEIKQVNIGQGEKGTQVLPAAEKYMFIIGDQVKMITYEGFCR